MPTPHHLVAPPVIIAATPVRPLASPQPAIAPSLPPVCIVDLMTLEGSAIFGAQWKTREAKIIEVPAIPDAMPEFTTTYDIDPHAGDDLARQVAVHRDAHLLVIERLQRLEREVRHRAQVFACQFPNVRHVAARLPGECRAVGSYAR